MSKNPSRSRISIEVDALDQQVCGDDQVMIWRLADDGAIVPNASDYSWRMLA